MKLASDLKTRRHEEILKTRAAHKYHRGRVWKRGATWAEYDDETDFRYMWAAYKMGAFSENFTDDFEQAQFREMFELARREGKWFILSAPVWSEGKARGMMPVGIVGCDTPPRENVPQLQPRVMWFPWASARNKLETAVRFFYDLRETHAIIAIARRENQAFFEVLKKYEVIRRAGTVHRYFDDGAPAQIWEAK